MKKKIVCALMCVAMAATALVGCGSDAGNSENGNTDNTENTDNTDNTADNADSASSGSGKVYYLNFKPEQADAWTELAQTYTDETGVQVTVQTAASGTYEQTLKSEMAKSEAPTLFQVNGPVGLVNWKDYCYDLKDSEIYSQVKSDDFVLKDGDAVQGIAYMLSRLMVLSTTRLC